MIEEYKGSKLAGWVGPVSEGYHFYCPGCKDLHTIATKGPTQWGFNGNGDAPTFTPSILVTSGHHIAGHVQGSRCWCTYNAENPHKKPVFKCGVCHSYVTDGKIQFLTDCTHELAGQTVDLPDYPKHESQENA